MIHFLLSTIFGSMEPGQIVVKRFFHPHNMAKNKTVIIISGPITSAMLSGALEVLNGNSHARKFPKNISKRAD